MKTLFSRLATLAVGVALLAVGASGQSSNDAELTAQLKKLFPQAATFSAKTGNPAHYKAFGPAAGGKEGELLGLAYWTTELEPLERGFDGPIKMLVGLNLAGEDHGRHRHGSRGSRIRVFLRRFARLAEAVRRQEHSRHVQGRHRRRRDLARDDRQTSASRAIRNSSRKIARATGAPPASAAGAAGTAPSQ
jgi:hypothetical protein